MERVIKLTQDFAVLAFFFRHNLTTPPPTLKDFLTNYEASPACAWAAAPPPTLRVDHSPAHRMLRLTPQLWLIFCKLPVRVTHPNASRPKPHP